MKELTVEEMNFVSGGWQSRGATSGDMGSPHEGRGGNGGNNPYNDRKGAIDKYDGRGAADLGIKIGRFFGGVGMTEADIRNMRDNNRGGQSSSGRGDGGNGRGGRSGKN